MVAPFFREPHDWPIVSEAYRVAIKAEVARMCETSPAEDLVLQWDVCHALMDLLAGDEPLYPWSPKGVSLEEKWRDHAAEVGELSAVVPEAASHFLSDFGIASYSRFATVSRYYFLESTGEANV